MNGCSSFHFTLPLGSKVLNFGRRFLFSFFLFLTLNFIQLPLLSAALGADQPEIVSATSGEWQKAVNKKTTSTLQLSFPTNFFWENDPLSQVVAAIAKTFPSYKLNTIGRGMHLTVNYFEDLSFPNEVGKVIEFLHSLDEKTLAEYDLLKKVLYLDTENPEVIIVGKTSKFAAIKPHAEFLEWYHNLQRLIQDKAPELVTKGLSSNPHISLMQWGDSVGVTPQESESEIIQRAENMIRSVAKKLRTKGKSKTKAYFSLLDMPLQFVTPPLSFQHLPIPIYSLILRNTETGRLTLKKSSIGAWINEDSQVVEFQVSKLLEGVLKPYQPRLEPRLQDIQEFPGESLETFTQESLKDAPQIVREQYQKSLKHLSPTKYPARVTSDGLYVAVQADSNLVPEKAMKPFSVVDRFGLHSTEHVKLGVAIYASSVRADTRYPGDYDLLINGLIQIPDEVTSLDAAEDFAAKIFVEEVLNAQFVPLAKQGIIAYSEMRAASEKLMGLGKSSTDPFASYEENTYLSEEDVQQGFYVHPQDPRKKKWSLEELVRLGGFLKKKISGMFAEGRKETSDQFVLGFVWKDEVYIVQKNGTKGVPPLLRTAVYRDASSYAIASIMSRASEYYSVQKGNIVVRAIRDFLKSAYTHIPDEQKKAPVLMVPQMNSKFLKKVKGFWNLLDKNGLDMSEPFFEGIQKVLLREGAQPHRTRQYNIEKLKKNIIKAINQKELSTLNFFGRVINDFRERNERNQNFKQNEFDARMAELNEFIPVIQKWMSTGKVNGSGVEVPLSFKKAFDNFMRLFDEIQRLEKAQAGSGIRFLLQVEHYGVVATLEKQIKYLDSLLASKKLTRLDREFIQTMVGYLPHVFMRYREARYLDSEAVNDWNLRVLGISPTEENRQLMKDISENFTSKSREQIAEQQRKLYIGNPCELLLNRSL